jgi:DNA sulfur modification protein DndD
VQRFLPPALADLFFFDGERIEGFADPARSGALLASAIHSLLGVDLVQQLDVDLDVLTRRRLKQTVQTSLRPELEAIEQQIATLDERRTVLLQEEAGRRSEAGQADAKVRSLSARLGTDSGEPTAKRRELESVRATLLGQVEATKQALIDLASGCLPLAILGSKLEFALAEGTAEVSHRKHSELSTVLAERDERIATRLEEDGLPAKSLKLVKAALAHDRQQRSPPKNTAEPIGIAEHTLHEMESLLRRRLPEQAASAREVAGRFSAQSDSLDDPHRTRLKGGLRSLGGGPPKKP